MRGSLTDVQATDYQFQRCGRREPYVAVSTKIPLPDGADEGICMRMTTGCPPMVHARAVASLLPCLSLDSRQRL